MTRAMPYEICDCQCHVEGSGLVHIMPCCYVCPVCKKRITTIYYQLHIDEHRRAGELTEHDSDTDIGRPGIG